MLTGNKMTEQVATLPLKEFVFLDFSAIQNFKDLQAQFVNAAQSLMSEHDLMHANNRWQITAIELYLFTESEMWRDVYTHQNPVQLESGTWYVHQRETDAPNWRAPNWSGLDITCGSRPSTFWGTFGQTALQRRRDLQRLPRQSFAVVFIHEFTATGGLPWKRR